MSKAQLTLLEVPRRKPTWEINAKMFKAVCLREVPIEEPALCDTPDGANRYWRDIIESDERHIPEVESFYVLHLNSRRRVTGYHLVASGTLDTLLVHPRETFRLAMIANAAAIVLMHNHPSGDPTPSEADIKVTRDLVRAGQLLKVEVLDHVIIGRATTERPKDFCSLRELGYFYQ